MLNDAAPTAADGGPARTLATLDHAGHRITVRAVGETVIGNDRRPVTEAALSKAGQPVPLPDLLRRREALREKVLPFWGAQVPVLVATIATVAVVQGAMTAGGMGYGLSILLYAAGLIVAPRRFQETEADQVAQHIASIKTWLDFHMEEGA